MQTQRQQGFVIPVVVIFVCLLAFGIPYLVAGGRDTYSDVVLVPRLSPTPTPLDRILTQQAFANLFFTPTNEPFLVFGNQPSPTTDFGILVTGNTVTPAGSVTPTNTVAPFFDLLTRVSGGGGLFPSPTSSITPSPIPTNTDIPTVTKSATPLPTNTPVPTETDTPLPTDTDIPTNSPVPSDTAEPPTDTPIPTDTSEPPPTDTPEPPPTDTPEPPATDTPDPGANGGGDSFGFGFLFLLPLAMVFLPRLFARN